MFNNLNDKVDNAVAEDILIAMGEESTDKGKGKTNADKTDSKKSAAEKTTKSTASTGPSTTKAVVTDMAKKDEASAFDDEDEDKDDEDQDDDTKGEKKKDTKKSVTKTVTKDEDKDDEDADDEEKDEDADKKDDEDKDDEEKDKDDENQDTDDVTVADFLKARVQLLLDKGGWKQFQLDGKDPDKIEWTEETFEEIELQQRTWAKEELQNEIMDSFGPYGKEIAAHISNGGNPDELIDIFKEEQALKAIDISTEEGQKEIIFQYQTQILKRKPARANQEIENLIANKMLQSDAEEAKEHIEENLKEQSETVKAEAATAKKNAELQAKQQREKFTNDVTDIVNKSDSIDDAEKKEVIKLLTSFKREVNGQKVNEFYFKMSDFRKNLANYIDLVRFVNNPEKFKKGLKNQGKTDEATKSFKLARGVQEKKKAKPNQELDQNRQTKKSTGFKLL